MIILITSVWTCLTLSSKPSDSTSDIYPIIPKTNRRVSDDSLIVQVDLLDESEIGLAYGMADEFGEHYTPVKPKHLALCCH